MVAPDGGQRHEDGERQLHRRRYDHLTVVLTDAGDPQRDNPGAEFTDLLPPSLTLVGASATSGVATPTVAADTVT